VSSACGYIEIIQWFADELNFTVEVFFTSAMVLLSCAVDHHLCYMVDFTFKAYWTTLLEILSSVALGS
jgi:hypothetical protein